jgi:acyl-coenzyme A thioesterase PaaI-like protein
MGQISRFPGTNFMGRKSPYGFGIVFSVEEDKTITTKVIFDEHKQGGPGILHGGAIAAVLDEAMGVATFEYGKGGFTATMTINYHQPIPLFQEVTVRAWIEKSEGKKVFAACETLLEDGSLAVSGTGLFIESEILQQRIMKYFTSQNDKK